MQKFLIVLFVLHIVLCIAFSTLALPLVQEKFGVSITQDEYDDLGRNLARGNGFRAEHGEQSIIRGPGYPVFLAVFYAIFGESHLVIQIAQAFLSGINVLLGYLLIRQLHSRRAAILGALLLAFNPFVIWYTGRIMVETLFTTTLLLIFLTSWRLVVRPSVWWAVATGLSLAAGAYIKSIVLVFPIAIFLVLLTTNKSLRGSVKLAGISLLVMVLLIAPWTARNYAVTDGEFIPVHASLALPLTQSYLCGVYYFESPMSTTPAFDETNEMLRVVTSEAGYEPFHYPLHSLESELRIEKAAKKYFRDLYFSDPFLYVGHTLTRMLMFWYFSSNPAFSLFWLLLNGLLLVFFIQGIFSMEPNHGWFVLVWVVFYWLLHSLIIASARFSMPLHPLMLSVAIPYLMFRIPVLKRLPLIREEGYNRHYIPRPN